MPALTSVENTKSDEREMTTKSSASDVVADKPKRLKTNFINLCERFVIKFRSFDRQYFVYYAARLQQVEESLRQLAQRRWVDEAIVSTDAERPRIVELKQLSDALAGQRIIVVGCLFKQMKLQPSILKELCQEEGVLAQPVESHSRKFVSDDDHLELQDYRENIALFGDGLSQKDHVTGIPVALLGQTSSEGSRFEVEDVLYYGEFLSIPPIPSCLNVDQEESDRIVIIVSGLGFTDADDRSSAQFKRLATALELLGGYLSGHFDPSRSSHVVRLICAGNFLDKSLYSEEEVERVRAMRAQNTTGKAGKVRAPLTLAPVRKFDKFLARVAQFLPVDVMPGDSDPGSTLMPQQPVHPCLFPAAAQLNTVNLTTNPYYAAIDGHVFLGSSGQPVDTVRAFSDLDDSTQILARSLKWGHICPSAPDNLACYPFPQTDPFLMKEWPHVYFAGNQPSFGTLNVPCENLSSSAAPASGDGSDTAGSKQVDSTLVVSVPEFSTSFMAVAINLRTRSCEILSFS